MALQLAVESREAQGRHGNRRLRQSGKIPGILYGHGLDCVPLAVGADVLTAAIRHGSRLVSLTGAVNESAFIRDLQWDTWGKQVLHVDFTRISEHEIVEVRVPVAVYVPVLVPVPVRVCVAVPVAVAVYVCVPVPTEVEVPVRVAVAVLVPVPVKVTVDVRVTV